MTHPFGIPKSSATARKKEKLRVRTAIKAHENLNKAKTRRRDRGCRFPLCGCRKLGLKLEARPEVSHQKHKGQGGNPTGDRSLTPGLIQLCKHRHQDAIISRHRGTLEARPINARLGCDGPVKWYLDAQFVADTLDVLGGDPVLIRRFGLLADRDTKVLIATESAINVLEPLADWQRAVLVLMGEMDV